MIDLIRLDRIGSTPWGTFGTLRLPDGSAFPTVEQRWEHNATGKSCIPAGVYLMAMRSSPVVRRTSGGEFNRGWEVTGVLNRNLIMLHPGNWASIDEDGDGDIDFDGDTEGCVLVGRAHALIRGKPGVSASRAAFKDLMHRLAKREQWRIAIRWTTPE